VVIFSDELHHNDLSCYGGKIPTPNLDRLAAEGARFTQAHCVAPACTPSRFAMMTGTYPGRCQHPAFRNSHPPNQPYGIGWDTWLTDDTACLPRRLGDAGYCTGHVGKWHLGFTDSRDDYDIPRFARDDDPTNPEVDDKLRRHQAIYAERIAKTAGFDFTGSVLGENPGYLRMNALNTHNFEWYATAVNEFLDRQAGQPHPFCLYLAPTALHGPNHAGDIDRDPHLTAGGRMESLPEDYPDRTRLRQRLEASDAGVTYESAGLMQLDDHVGYVLSRLDKAGVADNTIVIFAADHGREPGKATCYETGLRVPMIVRWPGRVRAGQMITRPVSHIDILPTILEAAGVATAGSNLDGHSFLSEISENQTSTDAAEHVTYAEMGYFRAIKYANFKYVAWRYTDEQLARMKQGEVDVALDAIGRPRQGHSQIAMAYYPHYFDADQLYDLAADPSEQHNLADDPAHAATLRQMRERLQTVLATFEHPYPLKAQPFRKTGAYADLVAARRKQRMPAWWTLDRFSFPNAGS
jgi:arylsulfatase A-like enzyme